LGDTPPLGLELNAISRTENALVNPQPVNAGAIEMMPHSGSFIHASWRE